MQSIISIFLSLSLLVSTTGISFLKHYCGGELAATQVILSHHNKPEDCGVHHHKKNCANCDTQSQTPKCHHSSDSRQGKDNCCDNELEQHKVTDQFVFSATHFKVILNSINIAPVFIQTLNHSNLNFTPDYKHYLREKLPNSYHAPEISVFIQSFLI